MYDIVFRRPPDKMIGTMNSLFDLRQKLAVKEFNCPVRDAIEPVFYCVHTIAVKVIDDEGLEIIETVKLKVNGVIQKL